MRLIPCLVVGVIGCSSDAAPAPAPLTAPGVAITKPVIAGAPIQCKVTAPSSGGTGTITYATTWTQDAVAFPGATATTLPGDTVPGTATHTGHMFACTVTASDEVGKQQVAAAQSVVVDARFAFVINDVPPSLMKIDVDTLKLTTIGPLGVEYQFGDLAWDPTTQTLYMVDGRTVANNRSLYRVDTSTGAATLIGSHGQADMFALGFDPVAGKLLGAVKGAAAPTLFALNTTTGAATGIGGTTSYEGLAYDTKRSQMTAILSGAAAVVSVNTSTGATTMLATPGAANDSGMTYDPFIDRFWVADLDGNLFNYDPASVFARTTAKTYVNQGFSAIALQIPPAP